MLSADVVVAGGGVAGLLIATALAPNCSVVVLEQRDRVPRNKYWLTDERAAEAVPDLGAAIDRRYEFLDFVAYDGLTVTIRGRYCLWDTDRLVGNLEDDLARRHVPVLTDHRLYSVAITPHGVTVRASNQTIRARLLVDCMGFSSPLVGAKGVATLTGYYILHGCEVGVRSNARPVALDNVILHRRPTYFELFPTAANTAHAALILPSQSHEPDRPLRNDLSFILRQSHYAEQIVAEPDMRRRGYFGIIPVGRLHTPAIDRIVFFGEAGQANPAASATGLTRMLRVYRDLAAGILDSLRHDRLTRPALVRALPRTMTRMNRMFQECLFENILSFTSDDFRRLVRELGNYPDDVVNELIFAEFDFTSFRTIRLALDVFRRPDGVLAPSILKAIARWCVRGPLR
jgi:flavin-dependent dehydrogenase